MYECPRCGSRDFAIDEFIDSHKNLRYDIMCRNCGCFQGEMNSNDASPLV